MGRLDGKVALITGAGGGIGYAYAERFLGEGAKVVIAEIDEAAGAAAADKLNADFPDRVAFVATDITKDESADAAANFAAERFGRLDILINNAAIYGNYDTFNNDTDYLRKVYDVNVIGQWVMAKACTPHLIAAGSGRIINIASVAGYYWQLPAMAPATDGLYAWAYNQSKWAVIGLSRTLAAQLGQHNITSNCIAPGLTDTPATQQQVPVEFQPMFEDYNPMKKLATVDDMTGVALFFASDDAGLVNGQIICVDGGGVMPS
jgi:3-oxoacyl-[acyl-carrier protein] reductase